VSTESTEIKNLLKKYIFPVLLLLSQITIFSPVFCTATSPFFPTDNVNDYPIQILDGENNEPLIGATVINITQNPKGDEGTVTDIDGKTALKNPAHRDQFRISYLGYATQSFYFFEIREKYKGVIKLYPGVAIILPVLVTGRKDQATEEIAYEIQRVGSKEIASSNAQNSADILLNAGVYVQKSQMGGGSPILRGFEGNRVLLVIDGVRMNNAIYRNGHLQNSVTIDNSILEQAEVIYGPGALMYGSDALGGVVHYKTRDPKLHLAPDGKYYQFASNAYTRFSTANKEKTIHLDLDYGTDTWGSLTSVTYSDFGDLTAGSKRPKGYEDFGKRKFFVYRNENIDEVREGDPDIQRGTAYSQIDLLQKVKFQPNKDFYMVLNLQYSTSSNVPRYDVLLDTVSAADDLKWAEWYYGPQQRLFASLKAKFQKPTALFDKATFIASFQRIDEDRLQRKYLKRHRTFNLEDVYVYGFTGDFDKFLDKKHQHTFSYGFEGNYNQVYSKAGRININTGEVIYDELTRYPSGGGTMLTYAGYTTYNWQSKNKTLNFNFGGRYTNNEVSFDYLASDADLIDWPDTYYDGVSLTNKALNWGIGLTYRSKNNWQFKAVTSTAFRAPNLDDLAKVRPKNGKATVPNTDLTPEFSLNYEATLGKQFGVLNKEKVGTYLLLSGTGFYTELTDAIVREKGQLPNGATSITFDKSEYEVQQNFNAGEAYVYGASGNLEFNWNDRLIFQSSINFTKGRRIYKEPELNGLIDTLVPMDHIPPMYGRASLIFQTEKLRIEGLIRFNGAKSVDEYAVNNIDYEDRMYFIDREGMSDNIEYGLINKNPAPEESIYQGLPAWMTYNLYASYQFNKSFSINIGLENIADIHYRYFSSGVSAPGRNFSIAFRGNF
jgi:hemoglobin/transferrin/lactoferrin receptor protein